MAKSGRVKASEGWLDRLAILSDATRLRILALCAREELAVGEIARALQLPQSTVSRQLKPLHEGGWLRRRVEGPTSLFRLVEEDLDASIRSLWSLTSEQVASSGDLAEPLAEDRRRLAEVLAARRFEGRSFFGRVGGEWDAIRRELFGIHFVDEALLGLLPASWTVADLGCGTGEISARLAGIVRRVVAVDREPSMIEAARRRLAEFPNTEVREGELESLPIDDGELDAAVISLVLHHLEDPCAAVREGIRVLRPGGVLLVIDMVRHDREAYVAAMGHRHLGFAPEDLAAWASKAGVPTPLVRRLRPDPHGRGPGLFAATFVRR